MFTGIVEEIGTIEGIRKGVSSAVLTIRGSKVLEHTKVGDSISVNGVCLTVTAAEGNHFLADVMHETLNRTALASLHRGSRVNLERAMAADGRFGGHMVAGHIDGVGTILSIERDDTAVWYAIGTEPHILRYVVEKGSVAVDGISLTVAKVGSGSFSVSAIPHTIRCTILQDRKAGDLVNLETDMIGKYVEKLLSPVSGEPKKETLTKNFLTQCGF